MLWTDAKSSSATLKTERRLLKRESPAAITYLEFENGTGGIVLNVSQGGLAFQAVAAVRRTDPIGLYISPNPKVRIPISAEVRWIDGSRKSGGLRFTNVSEAAREQMRTWLTRNGQGQAIPQKTDVLPPPTESAMGSSSYTPNREAPAPPELGHRHEERAARSEITRSWSSPRPSHSAASAASEPNPNRRTATAFRSQKLHSFAAGFLMGVFLLLPVMFLLDYHAELGKSLILLGEKLGGDAGIETHLLPATTGKNPTPDLPNSLPSLESSSNADNEVAPNQNAARRSFSTPARHSASDATYLPESDHKKHGPPASHYAVGQNGTAAQLWSAVEKGDTLAEIALAQLYVKGDGVPKNCGQARVLLRTAARRGNIHALEMLRQLQRRGCS